MQSGRKYPRNITFFRIENRSHLIAFALKQHRDKKKNEWGFTFLNCFTFKTLDRSCMYYGSQTSAMLNNGKVKFSQKMSQNRNTPTVSQLGLCTLDGFLSDGRFQWTTFSQNE